MTATLETELNQFTGTENYYRGFLGHLYTDGVKYLVEKANCLWLIQEIFIFNNKKNQAKYPFQVWKLEVDLNAHTAVLTGENGNGREFTTKKIDYTDFPMKTVGFYFQNNTLILPTEY